MSDEPEFGLPMYPEMPAEQARYVARGYKALAENFAQHGIVSEANRAERQSQWWLAYSVSLAAKPPAPKPPTDD